MINVLKQSVREMEEQENQLIQDKKNTFIKLIFTPNRDQEARLIMFDPIIWNGFPIMERFWYKFFCRSKLCSHQSNKQFLVDELIHNPCIIDSKLDAQNKCVSLTIIKSGTLEILPAIIHPFVRVSIVNLKTLKYVQKQNFDVPVFSSKERNLIITHNKTQNILEYRESSLDFIPPFSTPPFDLREKGESFAEWNEEFIINDEAVNLLSTNNIIFFELLDFNFFYKNTNGDDCIIPIAWGYLKPVGYSQTYTGRYKIQLYKHKYKRPNLMNEKRKTNNQFSRTPDVLFEFNWIKKEKYQTYLEIDLRIEARPELSDMNKLMMKRKYRSSVFNLEGEPEKDFFRNLISGGEKKKYDDLDQMANSKRKLLLRRKRFSNEPCHIPDRLLFKFNTAKLGCMTHEFSNDGKYIAAACTDITSLTTIKIFNVEDGVLKYHFKGHQQLIHHFSWSKDNLILVSAGSDHHVNLWQIPIEESNNVENLDYLDNEKFFKLCSLAHSSYVYCTSIFPDNSKEFMILATACFDGYVRFYVINFNYDERRRVYTYTNSIIFNQINILEEFEKIDFKSSMSSLKDLKEIKGKDSETIQLLERTVFDHRHPNYLIFDELGRLYIGDSLGSIHIYELTIANGKPLLNKIKIITHKELEGDNINKIMIEPGEKRRLIVHSRDNCIRLIDITKDKPKVIIRYFGLKCNKTNTKSDVSTDGQYVLAGSEEGKPFLWSLLSGIQLPSNKYEIDFFDAVSDVSWNTQYNMIALSGFAQEYPLLIYVYEKEEITIDPLDIKIKNENEILNKNQKATGNDKFLSNMMDNISDYAKEYKTMIEPFVQTNNFNNNSNI